MPLTCRCIPGSVNTAVSVKIEDRVVMQNSRGLLQCEGYRLDVGERRLLKNDQPVALPPKVFDLLTILVQNHGRLMEKDDLMHKLWPGTFVEESNLTVNISAL